MKFKTLIKVIKGARVVGKGDPELTGISENSKEVQKGHLFVCIPGAKHNGRSYGLEAADKGAKALVVEGEVLRGMDIPQLVVRDSREALALLANAYYGDPSKKVKAIGVTGTKGKTTTTYLIRAVRSALKLMRRTIPRLPPSPSSSCSMRCTSTNASGWSWKSRPIL
jgi:UDP-N-acetylmuramoyl-L-alanyl-D-glutamate--2,6-diaminopimelate ligase